LHRQSTGALTSRSAFPLHGPALSQSPACDSGGEALGDCRYSSNWAASGALRRAPQTPPSIEERQSRPVLPVLVRSGCLVCPGPDARWSLEGAAMRPPDQCRTATTVAVGSAGVDRGRLPRSAGCALGWQPSASPPKVLRPRRSAEAGSSSVIRSPSISAVIDAPECRSSHERIGGRRSRRERPPVPSGDPLLHFGARRSMISANWPQP
jgi:hypothetical protein